MLLPHGIRLFLVRMRFWLYFGCIIIFISLLSGCLERSNIQTHSAINNSDVFNNSTNDQIQCSICNSTNDTELSENLTPLVTNTFPTKTFVATPTGRDCSGGYRCKSVNMSCCSQTCYDPEIMTCYGGLVRPKPTENNLPQQNKITCIDINCYGSPCCNDAYRGPTCYDPTIWKCGNPPAIYQ